LIAEYFIKTESQGAGQEAEPSIIPIYIATSHFESLDSATCRAFRSRQLSDTLNAIFKDEPNCIVLGDFNFDNAQEY